MDEKQLKSFRWEIQDGRHVQKACDRMWRNGLFVKLYHMGLRSKLLGIIIELHSDMISCVLYKGHKSDWFKVLQGLRQGGVLSPFMFLCYNDDLLEQLTKCTVGLKMLNTNVSCPTVSDDMVLLALSDRLCFSAYVMRILVNGDMSTHPTNV